MSYRIVFLKHVYLLYTLLLPILLLCIWICVWKVNNLVETGWKSAGSLNLFLITNSKQFNILPNSQWRQKFCSKCQFLNILENLWLGILLHGFTCRGILFNFEEKIKIVCTEQKGKVLQSTLIKPFIISASLRSKIYNDEFLRIFMVHFSLLLWVMA